MKKVSVDNEVWEYFVGKHNVVVRSPRDEKKMIFTLEKITGRTTENIDKDRKKKTKDGMITPADLKLFIKKNFPYVAEEDWAA